MSYKCLLLEGINIVAEKYFKRFYPQITVTRFSGALDEKQLSDLLSKENYQFVGIRSKTKITKFILEQNPQLLAIGCFCIGTNQVNLEVALQMGIPVFHSPYGNTRSVAEMVIGLIISLARKLGDQNIMMHNGQWMKTHSGCHEIRNKVLGIVGYGHIGSQVSVLAEAMGMNVIYYDPAPVLPLGNATAETSLEDLLKKSNFISLHVPLLPSTENLIGRKELDMIPDGSYLINLSRGTVINLQELTNFLDDYPESLSGIALDVYPTEPPKTQDEFELSKKLGQYSNLIMTPHIGGATEEAQSMIGEDMAQKLGNYLMTGQIVDSVNLPNIQIFQNRDQQDSKSILQLTNIHINVRGILKKILEILDNHNLNVTKQFLRSGEHHSYVWIESRFSNQLDDNEQDKIKKEIITQIETIPENIRTRILP